MKDASEESEQKPSEEERKKAERAFEEEFLISQGAPFNPFARGGSRVPRHSIIKNSPRTSLIQRIGAFLLGAMYFYGGLLVFSIAIHSDNVYDYMAMIGGSLLLLLGFYTFRRALWPGQPTSGPEDHSDQNIETPENNSHSSGNEWYSGRDS